MDVVKMTKDPMPKVCPLFYIRHSATNPYCGCTGSLNQGHGEPWYKGKCFLSLCGDSGAKIGSRTPYYLHCIVFSRWYWDDLKSKKDSMLSFLGGKE